MLLHHEGQPTTAPPTRSARRLRGDTEAPLAVVFGEDAVLAEIALDGLGLGLGTHAFILPAGAWPRDEPAQVRLGAPALGIDHEAGGLDGSLGVPVGMTAAGQPRPGRLDRVLHARSPGYERPHVLE